MPEDIKDLFIIDEDIYQKRTDEYIKRLIKYCTITKKGEVNIVNNKFSTSEKVKVSLVARYLANQKEPSIVAELNAEELSIFLMIPRDQITARLNELKRERYANCIAKGVYKVNVSRIDDILNELENKKQKEKST